jgi:hypothetical protein
MMRRTHCAGCKPLQLDHITFACKSLAQAQAFAMQQFGTVLPLGGEHPLMGTHNLLCKIAPHTFLEFIAINPDAVPEHTPRWFNLDAFAAHGTLDIAPKFIGWVASIQNLETALAQLPFGDAKVLALSRGALNWKMGVPIGGVLPQGGYAPPLIEWSTGSPVAAMTDVGIALESLDIAHPQAEDWLVQSAAHGWQSELGDNAKVSWRASPLKQLRLRMRSAKGLSEWLL